MAGTTPLLSRRAPLRTAVALLAAVLLAVGAGLVGVVATPNAADASVLFATDLEPTPSDGGYRIVDAAGHVFTYGDAAYLGGWGALEPGEWVTALSTTSTGGGYWLFSTKGRVKPAGDAPFFGDMSATVLNGPVVGSIPTSSGRGYYMVASDGGIFAFGDAQFYGSMGDTRLNAPVRGLVPTASGRGYWLVASDGGIFAFGDAQFRGSMGSVRLNRPVVGMVRYGNGYLMVASDGGIFNFSDQPFLGSLGATPPAVPIVSVAATNGSPGYWMLDAVGTVYAFGAAHVFSPTGTGGGGGLTPLVVDDTNSAPRYSRDEFGDWIDADHDCQNTRAEVLIAESHTAVTFTSSSHCTVATGYWIDPWSDATTTNAHDFDIDHTVALANAWRSGAWRWDHARRVSYANELSDPEHLNAIPSGENSAKSDYGPEKWRPPLRSAWCHFARAWDEIKARWGLTATSKEWSALVEMATTC